MKDIEGFHILWTAPYFEKSKDDTYSMQDYELLTMILSALMWRKMNGPITLYGDARAIDYVEGRGLSHIWNGGIKEIQVPDSISPECSGLRASCMRLRRRICRRSWWI